MDVRRWPVLALSLAVLYGCGYLFWYAQTPMGQYPVVDGKQNLMLATEIAQGRLAREPFHRAPLYPAMVALPMKLGLPATLASDAARGVNLLGYLVLIAATAALARRCWQDSRAVAVAAVVVALYPVILFFVGDPYDAVWAAAVVILAVNLALRWLALAPEKRTLLPALAVGLLLALGTLLRSHVMPLAFAWPFVAALLARPRRRAQAAAAGFAGPLLSFLALGAVNHGVSGQFRIMPWQGSYNLWAGNGLNMPGKYYAALTPVEFGSHYDNPAKLEAIALFEAETGAKPPHDIGRMQSFWLRKTINHIATHPLDWAGLMLRKTYYLLNDYEQYDIKTYKLHKQLSPWLRWNPLGWGLLATLAVPGAWILYRKNKAVFLLLFFFFAAYAAGVLLFYTSNRFRVPLVPFLVALSAGSLLRWRDWLAPLQKTPVALSGVMAAIAFTRFFGAASENTFEQDYVLLASAALEAQADSEAIRWAERAAAMNPRNTAVREIICLARFNGFLANAAPLPRAEIQARFDEVSALTKPSPQAQYIAAVYAWKLGLLRDAQAAWRRLGTSSPAHEASLAALLWTAPGDPVISDRAEAVWATSGNPILEELLHASTPASISPPLRDAMSRLLSPAL